MQRVTVRYAGHPLFVRALARCLEREGLMVSYEPPLESRRAGDHAEVAIVCVLTVYGEDVRHPTIRGIVRLREHFPKIRAEIVENDAEGPAEP